MIFVLRGLLVDLWCIYVCLLMLPSNYVPQYSTYAISVVNGVANNLSLTFYAFFRYVQTSSLS